MFGWLPAEIDLLTGTVAKDLGDLRVVDSSCEEFLVEGMIPHNFEDSIGGGEDGPGADGEAIGIGHKIRVSDHEDRVKASCSSRIQLTLRGLANTPRIEQHTWMKLSLT